MAINQLNKYVWLVETIHRASSKHPESCVPAVHPAQKTAALLLA